MGLLKNRIAVPLIDAFGDAVMSSNLGKRMYENVDSRLNAVTRDMTDNITDSINKNMTENARALGSDIGTGTVSSGMLAGLGGIAGGGLAGLISGTLDPVLSNMLYPRENFNFASLPEGMQEKLKVLVKRGL